MAERLVEHDEGLSRRQFVKTSFAVGAGIAWLGTWSLGAVPSGVVPGTPLSFGRPLRVKPLLIYHLDERHEKTSWRKYGGLRSPADVDEECRRIGGDLEKISQQSEFPVEMLPLSRVNTDADAKSGAETPADVLLIFGASGPQNWIDTFAASKKPVLLFVRHKSGPVYLWYETAHFHLLRNLEDAQVNPNFTVDDVVVDDLGDVVYRLRALYGLHNTRGTRMLALGGLQAYSRPGQELGPKHAREVWGMELIDYPVAELGKRFEQARADAAAQQEAKRLAEELLAQPNVALETERRFVVNTFLVLNVIREVMKENNATNLGVANCMTGLIPILDTPPCLALTTLNDEGFTAFCHTDLTHTTPGVLLRWISNKPSFVCNSHFPHHGVITLAHCAAPRKMNGRDFEPTTIMTHYESDYGAATKVEYRKGQRITCIIPNLHCTKWFGFKGTILDSPNMAMCRSQMDVSIEGDWQKLTREMEGFHIIVCYGDYLREVGYALSKVKGLTWVDYSQSVS
jgi:L-fucose isomerase-like protein